MENSAFLCFISFSSGQSNYTYLYVREDIAVLRDINVL
jgi:hypothetical protein